MRLTVLVLMHKNYCVACVYLKAYNARRQPMNGDLTHIANATVIFLAIIASSPARPMKQGPSQRTTTAGFSKF